MEDLTARGLRLVTVDALEHGDAAGVVAVEAVVVEQALLEVDAVVLRKGGVARVAAAVATVGQDACRVLVLVRELCAARAVRVAARAAALGGREGGRAAAREDADKAG